MPLYLTGAHSSRITKPGQRLNPRTSSHGSSGKPTKSLPRKQSLAKALDQTSDNDSDDSEAELLAGSGKIVSTLKVASANSVVAAMKYTARSMFCELPDRAGMNSVRIAEVLNFHKNLPPLVSIAHVHALISASSKTEREIQTLSSAGKVRRLRISGRGNDVSGLSEILVLSDNYELLLQESGLPTETISAFLEVLKQNPRASSIPSRALRSAQITTLTRAGFLVGASLSGTHNVSLSGSSLVSMPKISRAHSGTSAAVGGEAAFEHLGGVGAAKRSNSEPYLEGRVVELALSAPNIGVFLRLVNAGRDHLLGLLHMSKHKQTPMYLLKERWDGGVDSDSRVSNAKKLRGEFSSILPAKTKKWKELNGLNFDWALEECLGAGLIELFETHSVGYGVRALV